MLYFFYDFIQCVLLLLILPKILWQNVFYGKFKHCMASYLTLSLPQVAVKKGRVFLIYAVSMGETRAAVSLFQQIKKKYPKDLFYILSRTETGHEEAKKSMKEADGHFLLPIDFSWSMKRFLKRLQPDVVILIESDFWMNFLRFSKKSGALLFLVSGKISLRSFERFKKIAVFSRKLFSFFDLICAQNALCQERFVQLGVDSSKVQVMGNLKFDAFFSKVNTQILKQTLGIQEKDVVLIVASTHAQEEEAILNVLYPLYEKYPYLKVLVVPRHPERFSEVEDLIVKTSIPMISYSRIHEKNGDERVILVDAMGVLLSLYQIANFAILGGSFFKHLKGHNILEPIQSGIPVIFGPYMSDQKDLVEYVLTSQAGIQTSLERLLSQVQDLLRDLVFYRFMQKQGEALSLQIKGASACMCEALCEKISAFKKETFEI